MYKTDIDIGWLAAEHSWQRRRLPGVSRRKFLFAAVSVKIVRRVVLVGGWGVCGVGGWVRGVPVGGGAGVRVGSVVGGGV